MPSLYRCIQLLLFVSYMKLPANPIINAKTCQDVNPWVGRKQLALAHIPHMHPILRRTGHRLFVMNASSEHPDGSCWSHPGLSSEMGMDEDAWRSL